MERIAGGKLGGEFVIIRQVSLIIQTEGARSIGIKVVRETECVVFAN